MTTEELRKLIVKVLDEMKNKADEMDICGVAVATVLNKSEDTDWIGEMKIVKKPYDLDHGWNLVGIAWGKCGEVIATGADSGNPNYKPMLGEYGFVGGAYDEFNGYKMAFSFSGALSEEDLEVAKFGIEKMKSEISSMNG